MSDIRARFNRLFKRVEQAHPDRGGMVYVPPRVRVAGFSDAELAERGHWHLNGEPTVRIPATDERGQHDD